MKTKLVDQHKSSGERMGDCLLHTFESWSELVDYARDGAYAFRDRHRGPQNAVAKGREEFTGTSTWAEAEDLARNGWVDGCRSLLRVVGHIDQSNQRSVVKRWGARRDVRGSTVNLVRAIEGHPLSMKRRVRKQVPTVRAINIRVSVGYLASTPDAVIETRGAAITALVDGLRRAGRPVSVWMSYDGSGGIGYRKWSTFCFLAPVLDAGQPLDISRLAFIAGHRSMLRRIGFGCSERITVEGNANRTGCLDGYYSAPYETPLNLDRAFDVEFNRDGLDDPHWKSTDAAAAWVRETLTSLGVKVIG